MTIIVTKPGIIIDVVGSYYDKNHDIKWAFHLSGLETHLHDILWVVHDGKNRGRSEGEENIREFPVTVGGRGRAIQCGLRVSLVRARGASRVAITEPERSPAATY